jgi:hypothetical protein
VCFFPNIFQNKDEILAFLSLCHDKQVESVDQFTLDMLGKESTAKLFDFFEFNSDISQLPFDLSCAISTSLYNCSNLNVFSFF